MNKNLITKIIQQTINQLEESYHFDLDEFSFIYNGLKAFIVDVRKKHLIIKPFVHFRQELSDYIDVYDLKTKKGFRSPDEMYVYLQKCMLIIANMLDKNKMGSVEGYMDHIWKKYDIAIKDFKSKKPMQNFINDITAIITMIDYSMEVQLSSMTNKEKEMSMISTAIQNLVDPDLEVVGVFEINQNGSIKKLEIKEIQTEKIKQDKPNSIDLSKIKTLNTKVI